MTEAAEKVELKAETLLGYAAHLAAVDAAIEQGLREHQQFLWSDGCAERVAQLRKGATIAEPSSGKRPIQVPDGLIHDWIGVTCIPGATIERTLALAQNYDNHKNVYQPEVIDSKLISRQGNDFQIYLRLRKKKIITVVLDTITTCITSPSIPNAGCASPVPRGFPTWKMRASRRKSAAPPIRVTDSCGGSIPTGDSRKETTAPTLSAGHLSHPRCAEGAGVDHRADDPRAAQGISEIHSRSNPLRPRLPLGTGLKLKQTARYYM